MLFYSIFHQIEYAIPQKDGIGSNTQIAVPGEAKDNKNDRPMKHKKLKDMTKDEREEYEYLANVRNISKLLGWYLVS